MRFGSFRK